MLQRFLYNMKTFPLDEFGFTFFGGITFFIDFSVCASLYWRARFTNTWFSFGLVDLLEKAEFRFENSPLIRPRSRAGFSLNSVLFLQ